MKPGKDKDFYASVTLRLKEAAVNEIASIIRQKVDHLYEENKSQYEAIYRHTMTPDQVTPQFAVNNYADTFLSMAYPHSDHNDARKRSIHKVFSLLPSIPFKHMKKRTVTSVLRLNSVAYLATSKANHEVAQLTGTIDLEPGQSIIIRAPSGVTGPIDISYLGRMKKG